jgi:hypothetical protein
LLCHFEPTIVNPRSNLTTVGRLYVAFDRDASLNSASVGEFNPQVGLRSWDHDRFRPATRRDFTNRVGSSRDMQHDRTHRFGPGVLDSNPHSRPKVVPRKSAANEH